jgi:hypothetical protein
MGTSFRGRTPEAILKEMMECQNQYGIQIFDIEDDNFTFDKVRAKKLMSLIVEAFGEGNLELSAMNGVSFTSLDGELLTLMKRAGFHTINLSFVSSDSLIRRRMGRPEPATGFDKILEKADQAGLNVVAYAILGMPGQTIEEMVDTLIYLMGKNVLIGPSVYYPTPKTPLFERCKKENVLPQSFCQWRSSAFPIETKEFDRLDLITLFRLARSVNFVKKMMNRKELSDGITWKRLCQVLKERAKEENEFRGSAQCDQDMASKWIDLLLLLINERSFFSMRKDPAGRLSFAKERSSIKVLDYFFERAWERLILKSRISMA